MGSEQSTPAAAPSSASDPLYSLASPVTERQESVCSEADPEVPAYVSYTVSGPIGSSVAGDSPTRGATFGKKGKGIWPSRSVDKKETTVKGTMVMVNKGGGGGNSHAQTDPELARLERIPSFLPIMRATLSGAAGGANKADPDILERLDYRGLLSLCQRTENHLRLSAAKVSTEQAEIGHMIREVDAKTASALADMTERQKLYARHADRLSRVEEMSHSVAKCHLLLNENIEQMETLNNMLPADIRLEPFVWTTK